MKDIENMFVPTSTQGWDVGISSRPLRDSAKEKYRNYLYHIGLIKYKSFS